MEFVYNFLMGLGFGIEASKNLSLAVIIISLIILCILLYLIVNKILIKYFIYYIKNNRINWDEAFIKRKVFYKLSHFIPGIIIYYSAPLFDSFQAALEKIALTYIYVISISVINALIDSANDIYNTFEISKSRPIKGLLQVIKIVLYIIMLIVIIANLIDKSPLMLLSGIGALTAVMSLVFKDSILGLVAGIQLISNNMLKIGDWIQVAGHGADGVVTEMSLNTVKVQNFDNTIATIPTYSLVSGSFINYKGMQSSGGRRIKRSIYIDVGSIRFCTKELIDRFNKIDYLKDYINSGKMDLYIEGKGLHNKGGFFTNIGIFRVYVENYLKSHSGIKHDMTLMVRQLEPTEYGLPLEVYVFANTTDWIKYEEIQADIFDHLLAIANNFELKVFQQPTSYDVKNLGFRP